MRTPKLAVCLLIVLGACGGGGSGAPPSAVLSSVTIVAQPGTLFLGQSYTFTMQARMSDGSTISVGGTWGSDAPAVATVNAASGTVQIVGLGEATIYVDYQGQRGTQRIRTTVRYEGILGATVRITRCTQTGDWASGDACDFFSRGDEFLVLGEFAQTDTTVTAVMELGESLGDFPSAPVAATISASGELRFESVHQGDGLIIRAQWTLRPLGLTQVVGTVVLRSTGSGASGYLETTADVLPSAISRLLAPAGGRRRSSFVDAVRRSM